MIYVPFYLPGLRDGRLDGRLSREVATCSACGRRTRCSAHRRACLYCGEALPAGRPFA